MKVVLEEQEAQAAKAAPKVVLEEQEAQACLGLAVPTAEVKGTARARHREYSRAPRRAAPIPPWWPWSS